MENPQQQLSTVISTCFSSHFCRYLSYRDLASLLHIVPRCCYLLSEHLMNELLKECCKQKWGERKPVAKIRKGARMGVSEFLHLLHWIEHSSKGSFPGTLLSGFDLFPMLGVPKEGKTIVKACCFLKPSTPWPFQNGLVVATKGSETLRVYLLGPHAYEKVRELSFKEHAGGLTSLVCSPKGTVVLALDGRGFLWMVLLQERLITFAETGIKTTASRMRPDMFLSEKEFYTPSIYCREDPQVTVRDLLLHEINFATAETRTQRWASEMPMAERMSILRACGNEFLVQLPNCGEASHFGCLLSVAEKKTVETRFGLLRNAAIGDWCLSPDKTELLVVALTAQPLINFLGSHIPMRQRLPRCESRFDEYLGNMAVYSLELKGGVAGKSLRPLFIRTNLGLDNLPDGLAHPYAHYLRVTGPSSRACLLKCGDRVLAAKMAHSNTRLFWLKLANGAGEFACRTGADKEVFDMTVDSSYLASFSRSDRKFNPPYVGKFCPRLDTFTIEGATRPREREDSDYRLRARVKYLSDKRKLHICTAHSNTL